MKIFKFFEDRKVRGVIRGLQKTERMDSRSIVNLIQHVILMLERQDEEDLRYMEMILSNH